ncbi:MAG: double-cubane-cluster-containing anaerobic reductase [Dehalococcoidia bacterium]|nr:double-cubane-cluster-containing anaerobic reductase [Dehalococcoidia bacterium]
MESETFTTLAEARRESVTEIIEEKKKGRKVIGYYCAYSPVELALAAGAIAVPLCGSKQEPYLAADRDLPSILCPIIRSSYDLAASDTCPFFHASDLVVAETTCDGKKKMYEILQRFKPIHVMNLPQIADLSASLDLWESEMRRLKERIEMEMGVQITDEALRQAISITNRENRSRRDFFDLNKAKPALISGHDLLMISSQFGTGTDRRLSAQMVEQLTAEIKVMALKGYHVGNKTTPRILVTGTPMGQEDSKVITLVEECGGLVVAMETCGGYRTVDLYIDETDRRDPMRLLAEKYLSIPCSVMSPNKGRIDLLERMIREFKVSGVIDLTWQACHIYNIESFWVADLVNNRLGLPFLHLETNFSDADRGNLRVRIEAFLEMMQ